MTMSETKNEPERDVFADAMSALGIDRRELCRRMTLASCDSRTLSAAMAREGWVERFNAAVSKGTEAFRATAERRFVVERAAVFRTGPSAMAILGTADLLAVMDPKLQPFAKTWTAEKGGLLLVGPTGQGKTAAAAAIVLRLLREAQEEVYRASLADGERYLGIRETLFVWTRATDLANARSRHRLGDGDPAIVDAAKAARLLVLDDLGWELQRDTTIPEVLSERYDERRVTIVTSGQSFEDLCVRYSEAVVRRILETGGIKGALVSLFPKQAPRVVQGGRA